MLKFCWNGELFTCINHSASVFPIIPWFIWGFVSLMVVLLSNSVQGMAFLGLVEGNVMTYRLISLLLTQKSELFYVLSNCQSLNGNSVIYIACFVFSNSTNLSLIIIWKDTFTLGRYTSAYIECMSWISWLWCRDAWPPGGADILLQCEAEFPINMHKLVLNRQYKKGSTLLFQASELRHINKLYIEHV